MLNSSKNAKMDDVMNSILSGQIDTNDVIEWLKTGRSSVSELHSVENSELIPHFINYIKNKCSWLCHNEKTTDKVIALAPDNISNGSRHSSAEKKFTCFSSDSENVINFSKTNNPNSNQIVANQQTRGNSNKVQTLTFGCAPYRQRGNYHNSKFSQRVPDVNNVDSFPSVGAKHSVREFPYLNSTGFRQENSRFSENHFENPDNKKANEKTFESKENNRAQNLNNLDAFPPLGAKTDAKVRRRITPTPVQVTNNFHSKFGRSHFTPLPEKVQSEVFRTSVFQDNSSDLKEERELLKATKNILPKPSVALDTKHTTNRLNVKSGQMKSCEQFIYPEPEKISTMREILFFSEVYCFLLHNALVPNVTSELYFLFELITSKTYVPDNSNEKGIFCSVHNCVYFAVSVLGKECNLLHILDKATLASLEEIPYLLKFSPQLVQFLNLCSLLKHDSTPLLPSLTAVPFQIEEDSRGNFPDEYSFICFKRQRDLFYEMLREWQESMECVDGKFQSTFLRKARQLISLGPNSINMFHLARLFQSQLIASCMCLEVNEVYDELLGDIQRNFPDKFKKLQERFLTPSCVGGPTPPPSFYGIQSFFAELISSAGSPSLNQHLINMLVCKILELNGTDIFSDDELSSLGTVRDKYVFLLHTLRLLGKFLGYVYFLPYKKEEVTAAHIVQQQLASRQFSIPPLNLPQLLKDSLNQGHVVLTVPWIVEFLSMVDPVGKNLKDIQEALNILTVIYRNNFFQSHNGQSHLFLRVIIGWLFGVLHYPNNFLILLQPMSLSLNSLESGVDSLSVIDKQLIHSCCPYLIEFKVLVYNFLNGIKDKKREVRKITPLSTVSSDNIKSPVVSTHNLEYRLEENFFFLHPSSVKKTTEFVSERMASKLISKVRMEVTSVKLSIVEHINNDEQIKSQAHCTDIRRKCVDEILVKKTEEAFKGIWSRISVLIENVRSEIDTIIPSLLSEDTKETVTDMCCKISFRMAVDKIMEWCNTNLLLDAIKADIRNKVQQISKSEVNIEPTKNLNASLWISEFRNTVVKAHLQSLKYDYKNIDTLCSKMASMINGEISEAMKKIIVLLSVDLYIALVVHYPDKCCKQLALCFVQCWANSPKNIIVGKLLLCPQNLKFLLTGKDDTLSQRNFVSLIRMLLNDKIISTEEFIDCIKELEGQDLKYFQFVENSFKELLIRDT